MQVSSSDFLEKTDYAYAVARIRALETKLIATAGLNILLSAPKERISPLFLEIVSLPVSDTHHPLGLLKNLEAAYTATLNLVKSLILEDEIKKLISLKYDYELLKLIVKEEMGREVTVSPELTKRSNFSYEGLKSLLERGKVSEVGETMLETYIHLKNLKDLRGTLIDHACDTSYFTGLFKILDAYRNNFIRNYFVLMVDAINIVTMMRLKLRGMKRATFRERYIPFGSIELSCLEQGFDLSLDGFIVKILLSPLSSILKKVGKTEDEEGHIAQVEKHLEEGLMQYLKASIGVTFGVEPLLAYLWFKEIELKNLRTILITKTQDVPTEEIGKHLRGFYG